MSAQVVRFPPRRSTVIKVALDGDGWLVLAGSHGWIHSSMRAALEDAHWLSENLSLPIREVRHDNH
jgi:hypothetical protein